MMNTGDFVPPVNGRGRKLLFDPDAVEQWVKSRQSPDNKSFELRQAKADATIQRHANER
jgi:hypothetical protein